MIEGTCPICGRGFTAKHPYARTCGRSDCQQLLRRKQAGISRACPICGNTFTPRTYAHRGTEQKTCSPSCGARLRVATFGKPGAKRKPRAVRQCQSCGRLFEVGRKRQQRFCSRSCVARFNHQHNPLLRERRKPVTERQRRASSERMKKNNPMNDPDVRARAHAATRGRGWLGTRGGNGAPMPAPQRLLHELTDWPTEVAIPTGNPQWHAAVVDLANVELKVAIECDGLTHRTNRQQNRDRIKEQMLGALGWLVLRFSNETIMEQTEWVLQQIRDAERQRVSVSSS